MTFFLKALRDANIARNLEWENKATPFTLVFWANEMAGEAGEACNILKKLDREHNYRVPGSRSNIPALTEELADVVICADLLAMASKIDYHASSWPKFPQLPTHNYSLYGARLAANVGRANAIVANNDMTPLVNRNVFTPVMAGVVVETKKIADSLGIDLEAAVRTKFNMTSEKLGWKTRL